MLSLVSDLPCCAVLRCPPRFHTLTTTNFRKSWFLFYMIFNVIIYAGQTILYLILFCVPGNKLFDCDLRELLFVIVTGINFAAVLFTLFLYIYLSRKFSGFPFKSSYSKASFQKISQVILYWSIARVVWGSATLVAYELDVGWLSGDDSSLFSLGMYGGGEVTLGCDANAAQILPVRSPPLFFAAFI